MGGQPWPKRGESPSLATIPQGQGAGRLTANTQLTAGQWSGCWGPRDTISRQGTDTGEPGCELVRLRPSVAVGRLQVTDTGWVFSSADRGEGPSSSRGPSQCTEMGWLLQPLCTAALAGPGAQEGLCPQWHPGWDGPQRQPGRGQPGRPQPPRRSRSPCVQTQPPGQQGAVSPDSRAAGFRDSETPS